jgi:hypothetical protein
MTKYLIGLLAAVLAVGCTTRSISNSDYRGGYYRGYNYGYGGELSELEVLGVTANPNITEQDIKDALSEEKKISLKRGDRVVVVQSGALFPDEPLLSELKPLYSVVPLSGVPFRGQGEDVKKQQLDKPLRLAAAKSGAKTMIVYWGILESGRIKQGAKIISWVPIIGKAIPDEKQKMRIRLKAAVIDVETGAWEFIMPEAYGDTATSSRQEREQKDQGQVARLKVKGYKALAKALTTRYQ